MNEQIHIHSTQSVFDGAGEPKDLVKKAKAMGAEFFALTDHGTMTGIFDAWDQCEKEGIPFVPGVEAYIEAPDGERPYHFILLSKDMEGYRGVSKAVSYSERHQVSGRPVMLKAELEELFGNKGQYHGHVIATTACIQGEAAQKLLHNYAVDKAVEKVQAKLETLPDPEDDKTKALEQDFATKSEEISILDGRVKELKALAKRPFKKLFSITKKKMVAQGIDAKVAEAAYTSLEMPSSFKADEDDKKLFETMKASKEAPQKASELEKELKTKKSAFKEVQDNHKKLQEKLGKRQELEVEIQTLSKSRREIEDMVDDARSVIEFYAGIFGREDFYVEVQNHGMDEEAASYPILAQIAREQGIQIVASNDVHMIEKEDTHRRELIRAKRFNKYQDASEYDKELYWKTDEELKEFLCKTMPADIAEEAVANIAAIGKKCHVERKKEGYYPVFPLPEGVTADEEIRRICYKNIEMRYPHREGWTKEHEERLEYELGVICKMGFADYHLIEQDIVEVAHLLGKVPEEHLEEAPLDKEELKRWCKEHDYTAGMGVGIGRGSAAGSIVCYLLGITGLDPLKYGLIFERFLNIERVSMPDIDTDFEPKVRTVLVKYVQHKYGEEYVCGIMTKGTQAAKGSVRNCARYLGDKNFQDNGHYSAMADAIANMIPSKPGITLKDCDEILTEKFSENADAMQIINDAKLVEGSPTQYGIHPAGVIISDKDPIIEHMPLMWDENAGMMKTQCNMIQAEKLGLLKMDFLVLGTLTVITRTLQSLKAKGIEIDLFKLEFEPEVLKHVYAEGNTTAVFQFESGGMREMLKKFKPDSFEDIILLNAAYRPGPMDFIPQIIEAKKTGKVTYTIPELEPILGNTYGSIIYQEQVMEIFQKLAGYSLGQADLVRRAMSKKHLDELLLEKEAFLHGDAARNIDGCEARGINLAAADELFERMTAFASYAFNKSHAAVYSYVSYITAWLKEHFPAEFLAQAMTEAVMEKLPGLIAEAKRYGVTVHAPSINDSENNFSVVNDKEILFGLGRVKHVKTAGSEITAVRAEFGRFTSVKNFFERTNVNINAVKALIKAGAFDSFTQSRKALLSTVDEIKECVDDIAKAKTGLAKAKEEGKDTTVAENKLQRAEIAADNVIIPISMPDDPDERLKEEHEVLGTFVTAHPLDHYETGETLIDELEISFGRNDLKEIVGVITELRIVQRKRDGKPMAFFKLEDHSGMIDVAMFTDTYATYEKMAKEGEVVCISGLVTSEYDEYEETEKRQLIVKEVKAATRKRGTVVLAIPSIDCWPEIAKQMEGVFVKDGDNLVIYDEELAEYRRFKTPKYVSERIFTLGLNTRRQ